MKDRMERAGRIVTAKEDSYKRVYAADGKSYTYPKFAENRLRVKGQLYFKTWKLRDRRKGQRKNRI